MNLSDFDYDLPSSRIAQHPTPRRDASRLLVLDRWTGSMDHVRFPDLVARLDPGDLLVFNDTRVIPARLLGRKPTGGRVEFLLVEPLDMRRATPAWRCLIQAARAPAPGSWIEFDEGLRARVIERDAEGWQVHFDAGGRDLAELVSRVGRTPLPPYIRRGDAALAEDDERYQTVYAERPGAVAAPTAGLHFTRELLSSLSAKGVGQAFITLHVGPGTFLPVREEQIENHRMHEERFEVSVQAAEAVATAKVHGKRIVAVGTTVMRALEFCATDDGLVEPRGGRCGLFIYPGFRFRVVDSLMTNFHLPRSTLLMLVGAFGDRERVLEAYREAIRRGYRFYSYGDAMWIRSS